MQLTANGPKVAGALAVMTASLLASQSPAHAQDVIPSANFLNDTASEVGSTTVDTAVLFYQESGGRVRAIEPTTQITVNRGNGDVLSAGFTYDSLTGATPNGAAPWTSDQTFIAPIHVAGQQSTVTSASGHSKIVTIPGTQISASQYTAPAGSLPLDYGFKDRRYAGDFSYMHLLGNDTRMTIGGAYSTELDYTSISGNAAIARDLFGKNTTLSLGVNIEFDRSRPVTGIPTPITAISGLAKGAAQSKTVVGIIAGITQTITPNWLAQLNVSYGSDQGYQTDPYKILSFVSPFTGAPEAYLYESRPRSRTRTSVYFGNKIAIGSLVTDASVRYYHDSWNISSLTADVSETVPIGRSFYLEPGFRYYHQTAAKFFTYYLIASNPLPQYASADSRLSRFSATTFSLQAGYQFAPGAELYLRGEAYRQTGDGHPAGAPGQLANLNLFGGVHAVSVMSGIRLTFR